MLIVILRLGASRGRWHIEVRAEGLSWRRSGRAYPPHRASWGDVKELFSGVYADLYKTRQTSYVVQCGGDLLAWTLAPGAKPAEVAESQRLIRLVAARTGLPLRQVAPRLMQSKRFGGSAEALTANGMPPGLARAVVASRRSLWARFWVAISLTTIPILVAMGLLFTARHWVEPYQPDYLSTYPQTIHTGPRIFTDAMASDMGNWPVQAPFESNGQVAKQFVDGAYQVSLPSPSRAVSLTEGDYGDAAVEVTASTNGTGSVGLILRACGPPTTWIRSCST